MSLRAVFLVLGAAPEGTAALGAAMLTAILPAEGIMHGFGVAEFAFLDGHVSFRD